MNFDRARVTPYFDKVFAARVMSYEMLRLALTLLLRVVLTMLLWMLLRLLTPCC
jgi:hypothetical protein